MGAREKTIQVGEVEVTAVMFAGGTASRKSYLRLWQKHRDDPCTMSIQEAAVIWPLVKQFAETGEIES